MTEHLIAQLRLNDPQYTDATVSFRRFRNDRQVAQFAEALHENDYVDSLKFEFSVDSDDLHVNWSPLFRELETRVKLEKVEIWYDPLRGLLPLFRDQFFQALQENTNMRQLHLKYIVLTSNNTDGIASLLDRALSALTDLSFTQCAVVDTAAASSIAAALKRNSRIQTLDLGMCSDNAPICSIFRSLASAESMSCLKKINFEPLYLSESVAEAVQQYLESDKATIRCLKLRFISFHPGSPGYRILRGLSRNTSVHELDFLDCSFGRGSDDEANQEFASFVRDKTNLSALKISSCNFFGIRQCFDAVNEVLTKRDSSLRYLNISIDYRSDSSAILPVAVLRDLMTAASRSTQLERLIIQKIYPNIEGHVHVLQEAIPSLKIKELVLTFTVAPAAEQQENDFVAAFQRNYSIQNGECEHAFSDEDWFSDTNQAWLGFYLDRNQKLAEWTETPQLVPRELWSYAVNLALKAGINPLYSSLLALSGEGVGVREQSRKRKRHEE